MFCFLFLHLAGYLLVLNLTSGVCSDRCFDKGQIISTLGTLGRWFAQ